MKRSISKLLDYNIITRDEMKSSIKDFLFDEDTWTIRYIEVDYGSFFSGKRVLIPNVFIRKSQLVDDQFFLDISNKELENCPKPEEDLPVSRIYEEQLARYYNLAPYWSVDYPITGSVPLRVPSRSVEDIEVGTSLRSFKEVRGYDIITLDGRFGIVEDLIVDDTDWKISYMVIDTSAWLPLSKKLLLDISIVESISYRNEEATVQIHEDELKSAPEYDSDMFNNPHFEQSLQSFYSKHLVH